MGLRIGSGGLRFAPTTVYFLSALQAVDSPEQRIHELHETHETERDRYARSIPVMRFIASTTSFQLLRWAARIFLPSRVKR